MWGEYHPLPYQSKLKEKIVGRFSFLEFGWIVLGVYLSYQISILIGPITFLSGFILPRLHYFIPFAICMLFSYGEHPQTGLNLASYLYIYIAIRLRRRKFLYKKVNIAEGESKWS